MYTVIIFSLFQLGVAIMPYKHGNVQTCKTVLTVLIFLFELFRFLISTFFKKLKI